MADFHPDFRLDGYQAATPAEHEAFWRHIGVDEYELRALAEHHTPDHQNSFFVFHNGAATWGIPGEPQLVALHLKRDPATRTFHFEHAVLPLAAMAQSWLITRGCPRPAIALSTELGTDPADKATIALQERLIGDANTYTLLTSYTRDTDRPAQTAVMLRSLDPGERQPFRILLEPPTSTPGSTRCAKAPSPPTKPPTTGGTPGPRAKPPHCPHSSRQPAATLLRLACPHRRRGPLHLPATADTPPCHPSPLPFGAHSPMRLTRTALSTAAVAALALPMAAATAASAAPAPASAPSIRACDQPGDWTIGTRAVTIRSRATTHSTALGILYRGHRFTVHSTRGGWHYLTDRTTGITGWVSGAYVYRNASFCLD
ncbi:SH3 domain-containing protein [Streptomyces sp. NPDC059070]|uniref:SH3 domain-containing protein n=1 Tax=Streptomyces sp. NPDC059070 TaxID=3346713 RepID=UPI00367FA59D